jgi:hypothetical protein
MDRPPLAHVIRVDGEWIGKVREHVAVFRAFARFGSVEEAKAAVERELACLPELVSGAANLNRPQPERMDA